MKCVILSDKCYINLNMLLAYRSPYGTYLSKYIVLHSCHSATNIYLLNKSCKYIDKLIL